MTAAPTTSRGEFIAAFGILGALLLAMKFHDVGLPLVSETHGDVLRQMGQALGQVLEAKAANRQEAPPENSEKEP